MRREPELGGVGESEDPDQRQQEVTVRLATSASTIAITKRRKHANETGQAGRPARLSLTGSQSLVATRLIASSTAQRAAAKPQATTGQPAIRKKGSARMSTSAAASVGHLRLGNGARRR